MYATICGPNWVAKVHPKRCTIHVGMKEEHGFNFGEGKPSPNKVFLYLTDHAWDSDFKITSHLDKWWTRKTK